MRADRSGGREAIDGEGMGKKKASVDSDYSGRPLDRPTPEDLDDMDWHDDLADLEGIASADGSYRLVAGHDDRYYYPGRNGWPDYDRGPINPDTGEPIARTPPVSDEHE